MTTKPATQPLSLTALKVLDLVRRDGAITKSRVARELKLDSDEVKWAIVELLVQDQLVWIGSLPRSGVFFTLPENKGKSGFGLLAHHGAINRESGSGPRKSSARITEVRAKLVTYLQEDPGNPASIENFQDAVPELGLAAIRRHVKALESRGVVRAVPQKTGGRGRPWFGYVIVPEEDRPVVSLTDNPYVVHVRGAELSAMTRPHR